MNNSYRNDGWNSWPVILIVFILFWPLGVFLLIKKLAGESETSRYLSIIHKGQVRSLDSIGIAVGKPYSIVKADIQRLINKGILKNAYINEATRGLVILDEMVPPKKEPPTPPKRRAVTCPHCGANNIITGANGICEYCDSPIE